MSLEILSYQGAKFGEPFVDIPGLSSRAAIRPEMTYWKHPSEKLTLKNA
jgi:hypothetical protein